MEKKNKDKLKTHFSNWTLNGMLSSYFFLPLTLHYYLNMASVVGIKMSLKCCFELFIFLFSILYTVLVNHAVVVLMIILHKMHRSYDITGFL